MLLAIVTGLLLFSCKKERNGQSPSPVPGPVKPVLLKEIEVPNLPSPYYHFTYNNSNLASKVSFASGLRLYDVVYDGSRIGELANNTMANKDRLQYIYNNAGQPEIIKYIGGSGVQFKRCFLFYEGAQLRRMEWEKKVDIGFLIERTLSFVYRPDGNLLEMTDHLHAVPGQDEASYTTRFEQYDENLNMDDFRLIHEGNDHLLLLPGIHLQKNNPGKLIHSGGGSDYTIDYSYTYNEQKAPLTRIGDVKVTSGPNAGQRWQSASIYRYYP